MKSKSRWIAAVMMVSLIIAVPALAGKGTCLIAQQGTQTQQGSEAKQQFCRQALGQACPLLSEGEPVTITGTVYEDCYAGRGLILDTGAEEMTTIYGIGPQWYWDQLAISKPDVGDTVTVDALVLTFSDGTQRVIATSVTIGETLVDLRDADGKPLWRHAGRQF